MATTRTAKLFRLMLLVGLSTIVGPELTKKPALGEPINSGNPPRLGTEFRVNTTKMTFDTLAPVASLRHGGFIVAWTSSSQDASEYLGIFGQRFSVAGTRAGTEFRINTTTAGQQWSPSVAGLSDGSFVVAWESYAQDGSDFGIFGQRFTAAGVRAGTEFRINTTVAGQQSNPSVAGLTGGGFVVTWESYAQDGAGYGVYGQRYTAAGVRAGAEFRINATKVGQQRFPSIAGLGGGGFVVTWHSYARAGSESDTYGQRYTAAGVRAGTEFRINTTKASLQWFPSVAGLTGGGFIVAWMSPDQDGAGYGIYGRRYTAAGMPIGPEFRINTTTAGEQILPSAAGLKDGGFVVTWTSAKSDGLGGAYGQRYSAAGDRASLEFRIDAVKSRSGSKRSVSGLSDGSFVVMWESYQGGTSTRALFGQRFGP